eukprot:362287-Chlamydomonas_euryale.AAC.2
MAATARWCSRRSTLIEQVQPHTLFHPHLGDGRDREVVQPQLHAHRAEGARRVHLAGVGAAGRRAAARRAVRDAPRVCDQQGLCVCVRVLGLHTQVRQ